MSACAIIRPQPPACTETAGAVAARFLAQFNDALIYLLLAAAVITAALGHGIRLPGVILAVVLVNALIGFVQEGKAEKALDAIRKMLAPKASVIRNRSKESDRRRRSGAG